jgi:hypothetical protein
MKWPLGHQGLKTDMEATNGTHFSWHSIILCLNHMEFY